MLYPLSYGGGDQVIRIIASATRELQGKCAGSRARAFSSKISGS
jgi:hypothetical protein